MEIRAITVKQLNLYVKSLLEGDVHLQSVALVGELSNFKNHYASGHLYFTLKDKDAAIRCVMFRSYAVHIPFIPEDGKQVILIGKVSLYEKDGQYQFYAEQMLPAGSGDLAKQFEEIKERLNSKGMFAPEHKRPLPKYPKNIAVVTSETGAAVQDILNILGRRWPMARVIICPVSVQGKSAVSEMLDALDRLYKLKNIDAVIIGRGGGSAEDLWEFNSEELAEKIFSSPVPVISAVGHETDFSISDFVADLRAPTPSAAAELATPDAEEIKTILSKYESTFKTLLLGKYNYNKARLDLCLNSFVLKQPTEAFINARTEQLDKISDRLISLCENNLSFNEGRFALLAAGLDALSPLKVLTRGYTVALKNNDTVKSVSAINENDSLTIKFSDGEANCLVKEIIPNE